MAGKRRFFRKKKPQLSKNTRKAVNKQIKTYLAKNIETKSHNVSHYLQPSTTYDSIHLSGLTAGTDDSSRIGDAVTLGSLRVNYMIKPADTTNMIRMVIVQWKELLSGSTPTWGQIFYSSSTSNDAHLLSTYHLDNLRAGRFVVLYDKLLKTPVGTTAGETYSQLTGRIKVNLKFAKRHLTYDAASSACYDGIYMLAISDSSTVSHPLINIYSSLTFKDA